MIQPVFKSRVCTSLFPWPQQVFLFSPFHVAMQRDVRGGAPCDVITQQCKHRRARGSTFPPTTTRRCASMAHDWIKLNKSGKLNISYFGIDLFTLKLGTP